MEARAVGAANGIIKKGGEITLDETNLLLERRKSSGAPQQQQQQVSSHTKRKRFFLITNTANGKRSMSHTTPPHPTPRYTITISYCYHNISYCITPRAHGPSSPLLHNHHCTTPHHTTPNHTTYTTSYDITRDHTSRARGTPPSSPLLHHHHRRRCRCCCRCCYRCRRHLLPAPPP